MRKYHFISGLPRSGSTLLSAILKQNPRFTTGISDPLHGYIKGILQITNTAAGMEALVDIPTRVRIMKGIFDSFYSTSRGVCFNTNRGWSSDTALLKTLYPDFRMIICLRDIPWILDSFERLNNANPHTIKPLYNHQDLGNVYDRCRMLMGAIPGSPGYVSGPLTNVKHSFYCSENSQLFFMEYDHLVKNPGVVMRQIYDFLGEEWFEHDFSNVEDSWDEFDNQARISGLHTVRREVRWVERRTTIPGDLWNDLDRETYWKYSGPQIKDQLRWSKIPTPRQPTVMHRQL